MMNFASGMALGDASPLWSLIPKTPPPAVALKLESRGGVLGLPASPMTCSIEAEKPPNRTTELQPSVEQPDGNIVWRSNKDIAPFASKFCDSDCSMCGNAFGIESINVVV